MFRIWLLSTGWTHFDLCRLVVSHLGIQSGSYLYMRQLDRPSSTGSSAVLLPDYLSPIGLPALGRSLHSHPDREFVSFIVDGWVSCGFLSCVVFGPVIYS